MTTSMPGRGRARSGWLADFFQESSSKCLSGLLVLILSHFDTDLVRSIDASAVGLTNASDSFEVFLERNGPVSTTEY